MALKRSGGGAPSPGGSAAPVFVELVSFETQVFDSGGYHNLADMFTVADPVGYGTTSNPDGQSLPEGFSADSGDEVHVIGIHVPVGIYMVTYSFDLSGVTASASVRVVNGPGEDVFTGRADDKAFSTTRRIFDLYNIPTAGPVSIPSLQCATAFTVDTAKVGIYKIG